MSTLTRQFTGTLLRNPEHLLVSAQHALLRQCPDGWRARRALRATKFTISPSAQ